MFSSMALELPSATTMVSGCPPPVSTLGSWANPAREDRGVNDSLTKKDNTEMHKKSLKITFFFWTLPIKKPEEFTPLTNTSNFRHQGLS